MELNLVPAGPITSCKYSCAAAVRNSFQLLTTTLLSLLLPLSFLLLARLSTSHYLLSVSDSHPTAQAAAPNLLCSLFLYTKTPTILHILVSLVTVSSLIHALTGKTTIFIGHNSHHQPPVTRSRLCGAWVLLCLFQLCVGLGVEGSIASGIDGSGFGQQNSFLGRITFFFGLHETMMFWGESVLKPVVDDTIFGYSRSRKEAGMAGKVAVGLSYGGFWWRRLRDEVESLVMVPELKRELEMPICAADFMGWWLYYLTASIGMIRLVKGSALTLLILVRRRRIIRDCDSHRPDDEKV
ncbi:uncharacterized protein LOC127266727 [Andrographis paniculata]|uniref:uncharacterized protein LOC127266727 n=1 Tax=Andrographis paniculata TaxID=175694 RepID=UPI0021E8198D|nr:uncharacterized protein LOC127266727 [Andrographis paniculata]